MAKTPAPAAAPAPKRAGWCSRVLKIAIPALAIAAYPIRLWCAGGVSPYTNENLQGQVYVVTGANTGIGFETARELARMNATVVMACRSMSRCQAAADSIIAGLPYAHVEPMRLDLGDLDSVRAFASEFKGKHSQLKALVNNAGVMIPPLSRTAQGFELQFGTNHLGHFLLTHELLTVLKASAPSRVINVASRAHDHGSIDFEDLQWEKRSYGPGMSAYAASKLANVLFSREFARRFAGSGVSTASLHPGVIRTELSRHLPGFVQTLGDTLLWPLTRLILKSPWEGAQTQLYTLFAPEVAGEANGAYFFDCAVKRSPNPEAHDDAIAARLWEESARLVGITQAEA